jgi:1-deoxy-D-xylulose-5-phosphate reductoisomerase
VKHVVVLGSTGSVGRTTLDVIRRLPEEFNVIGLAARRSWESLVQQAEAFRPEVVGLVDPPEFFADRLPEGTCSLTGPECLWDIASWPEADIVMNALVGSCGLVPTLRAIAAGHDVCIANKETLVVGGEIVSREALRMGVRLIPVDSEHSAVAQCLRGRAPDEVVQLVLTASGGPFLTEPEDLSDVSPRDALRHPVWAMGSKISVDSATLMNKGLEVIEARWLFDVPQEQIAVLVHPQGIVHGMVELRDGSAIACLAPPDMSIPVQNALTYPLVLSGPVRACDLATTGPLQFIEPDVARFPCLRLAREALQAGGTMPAVLSAADEVAVERFLAGEIPFPAIAQTVAEAMERHAPVGQPSLEAILEADSWAREVARRYRC